MPFKIRMVIFFPLIFRIREIDQNTHGVEWNEAKGLEVFFSHVNEDELMSSTEMVFLPTLATSATAVSIIEFNKVSTLSSA